MITNEESEQLDRIMRNMARRERREAIKAGHLRIGGTGDGSWSRLRLTKKPHRIKKRRT